MRSPWIRDHRDQADDPLSAYAQTVRAKLSEVLPDGRPGPWLYEPMGVYPNRPSKGLRPGLLLATCEAFGGNIETALGVAVAIELFHNAFLVHDDIVDRSQLRRGQPTLHEQFGTDVALNAGDALAMLAQAQLRRGVDMLPSVTAEAVLDEFETTMARTVEGQATELGWRRGQGAGPDPQDYLEMILHKTCWYTTILPLRAGALIGSSVATSRGDPVPEPDVDELSRFGFCLGAVFQIRDDLLNLLGDHRYGKEIDGDLVEGKHTLMIIHLATSARGADRLAVADFLHAQPAERTPTRVAGIRSLMETYGSIEFAQRYAEGIAVQAQLSFERAFGAIGERNGTTNRGLHAVSSMVGHMLDRVR